MIKDRIKELRRVPAKSLVPHASNWRTHPDSQRTALRGVLDEIGYAGALLVRELPDGKLGIIDGHLRAETTPNQDVPVLVLDVTEEEATKLLLTFDPLSAMAVANKEMLESVIKSVQVRNDEVKALVEKIASANKLDLESLTPKGGGGDEFDGTPKEGEPKTQVGDLWVMGGHRLLCGDSRDAESVAWLFEDGEKAVLMNTDPPYGVDYAAVKNGIPRPGFQDIQARGGDIENDDLTSGPELQEFLETMIRSSLPHLCDNPAFYLWHPMLTQGTFFAAAAAAADILIHRQIIWVKPHMVLTRSGMYHWQHELCFYGWIRGKQPAWYGNKSQTSVWNIGEKQQGREHPTQKPIELFSIPIQNHTRTGEICYEPFAGSGSQFIAAERLGRRCYGIEIAPKYCDVIIHRWELETGKKAELLTKVTA